MDVRRASLSEAAEKRKERERTQRTLDARNLQRAEAFRRFAYWVVFQLAPADGPTHAGELTHVSAFNEGRRSMAIDVGRLLRRANFEAFQKMEREAHSAALEYGVHAAGESSEP